MRSGGQIETGGIPAEMFTIELEETRKLSRTIDVNSPAAAIVPGDLTGRCLVYIKAVGTVPVEYGIYVSAVFYAVGSIEPGMGYVKLGIIEDLSDLFLHSEVATQVDLVAHQLDDVEEET
jgi:hypothetical protein